MTAPIGELFACEERRLVDVTDEVGSYTAVVNDPPWPALAGTVRPPVSVVVAGDMELAGLEARAQETMGRGDTVVGIGGTGVSGGQAQRISIARALLKNPPLLLLDEATASLDSLSEKVVQDALDRLMAGRTTFVVAHRLSSLRGASRIVVLENGVVSGLGSHTELLDSCAVYREMWSLQSMGTVA